MKLQNSASREVSKMKERPLQAKKYQTKELSQGEGQEDPETGEGSPPPRFGMKHIFFDIDDTLFPTTEFAETARKNAIRAMIEMGLEKNQEELYELLMESIKTYGPNYPSHFDEMCRELGVENSARYVAAAVSAYHNTKTSILPYPEVPRVLIKLKERGYKLYAATNGTAVKQWDKIIRLGLHLLLDDVFVSEEVGVEKGGGFFEKVLAGMGVNAGECMMIGDKPLMDIEPAKKIGMKTVRVKRGKHAKEPSNADYEIRDFRELLEILKV